MQLSPDGNLGLWIEPDCTIEHEGRKFEASGAMITPDHVIGYVGESRDGVSVNWLTDWHGNVIGTVRLGKGWRINSYITDRMYHAHAIVKGAHYNGRTAGKGMIFKGKRSAK